MMKNKEKRIKIQQIDVKRPDDEFDRKLVAKYFNDKKFTDECILIKLYKQRNERQRLSPNKERIGTDKNRFNLIKRALSPQPHMIYFGIKDSAFFNKRAGVLKPNIKFKILNLMEKNKESSDRKFKDANSDIINTQEVHSQTNKFSSEVISMMAKYTKRFLNNQNEAKDVSNIIKERAKSIEDNNVNDGIKIVNNQTSHKRHERFRNLSKLFESNKYVSRIKISSTFNQFNNIMSEEEIRSIGQKIWNDAHHNL